METKTEESKARLNLKRDLILDAHACELLPGVGSEKPRIRVQSLYTRGWLDDRPLIHKCLAELEIAGIDTNGWKS